jgi:hypothetical protein
MMRARFRKLLCRLFGHARRVAWERLPQSVIDAELATFLEIKAQRIAANAGRNRPPAYPPRPQEIDLVTRCSRCGVRL